MVAAAAVVAAPMVAAAAGRREERIFLESKSTQQELSKKKMGKKGYVVFRGRNPGVYYDWDSCNEQVWGFSGASFRSYSSGREAEVAWEEKLGRVGRRSQELESPSVHRRQSPPSESSVGVKIACMSHEQCSTPAIDSPSSLTSVMAHEWLNFSFLFFHTS
ncbi:hypothetical protein RIF29_29994 [Crotalaria pallida]|uniref:Ribonuclease H1 N-terminal domain-containing protein n=1 Tax=Crotalaria pallida TaxID=3830 RepID=A0AAN9I0X0_CROPI